MKSEAVMIIKESEAVNTITELGAAVAQENVLLKIIPDLEFDLMFGHTVNIDLDLEKETQFELMRLSHEKGISLDLLINQILLDKINEVETKGMNITAKADTSFEVNIKNEDGKEVLKKTVKPINLKDLKIEINNTIIERPEKEYTLEDLINDVCN